MSWPGEEGESILCRENSRNEDSELWETIQFGMTTDNEEDELVRKALLGYLLF